jgi:tetratricopeptide (TPR) repeat protein
MMGALRTCGRRWVAWCCGAMFTWGGMAMAIDLDAMWDFDQPARSEERFRAALAQVQGDDALVLRTQLARTFSLRGRFDEAHRELDALEPLLAAAGPEPRVRALLERGRTLRSAGQPAQARPLFQRAFDAARAASSAGLAGLAADALHMLALVEPTPEAQQAGHRKVVDYARAATDPKARYWEGPALNNLGVALNDAGRHDEALAVLREALAVRERAGRPGDVRVARWMVAHTLRRLRRTDEALAMQLDLEAQFRAAGETDPYVFEELALLYAAQGNAQRAAHYRALAAPPPPAGGS